MTTFEAILFLAVSLHQDRAADYAEWIDNQAAILEIDPLLVVALIHHESRFKTKARKGGNYGLMQVRVSKSNYRALLGREHILYRPRANIRLGMKLLAWWRDYHHKYCLGGHPWWAHYQHGRKVRSKASALRVAKTYKELTR